MKKINNVFTKSGALVVAISCFVPSVTYATNGLFMIGTGNKSRAMGGVGIAHALDSVSVFANPAVMSGMADRFDIGVDIFKPAVESQLGSVSVESVASVNGLGLDSVFFLPAMGIIYNVSDDVTLGASMVPRGGGGTKFLTNFYNVAAGANPDEVLGIDFNTGSINASIAYKVNEQHSIGTTLIIGISRFEAYGLQQFATFTPSGTIDHMSNNGKEWSVGAGIQVGWMGNFGDVTVGAQYTSKTWMDKFDSYSELFAEGGRMNIPANTGIGISYRAMPTLVIAADVTYTFYEDTPAISNIGPNLAGDPNGPLDPSSGELGTSNGLGFGWENQTVLKIGAEYGFNEKWIGRLGWNYGASPINQDREIVFNLLAPATTQNHLTFGGTYVVSPTIELNASFIHAFWHEQSGPTYLSDDGSNLGRFEMSQNALGFSFSMKY